MGLRIRGMGSRIRGSQRLDSMAVATREQKEDRGSSVEELGKEIGKLGVNTLE